MKKQNIYLWIWAWLTLTSAALADFSFPLPPNYTTISSAKRNHVFYVGEAVAFTLSKTADHYEVRDYYGAVVASGTITAGSKEIALPGVVTPGWYKLYVYGAQDQGAPWGTAVAGTTFVIFRNTPDFPTISQLSAQGGSYFSFDNGMRGLTGMGPQRLMADASNPDQSITNLEQDVTMLEQTYTIYDSARSRPLLISFPNGTANLDGVRKIADHFKDRVQYWEPLNEPNSQNAFTFATGDMKSFYQTIKSVSPTLKVLGPGTVSINLNLQSWLASFGAMGGYNYVDAFSFHAYNVVNGDMLLARKSLNALNTLLTLYGAQNKEKWQTEQGYFAAVYGSYQPRLQGRWTMVQMMIYEQFGIPKEHNDLWYDKSHGFWSFPSWSENDDGSLNPAAALMRVWSEELHGKIFSQKYDFGTVGENLYVGSLFTGAAGSMAAFMTAGNPYGTVKLNISGGTSVHIVSPFGVESDSNIVNGRVVLPVSELPTYVRLTTGQTCTVVTPVYGENLARGAGVTVSASGAAQSPLGATIPNDLSKLINGVYENWYYSQSSADYPWMSNVTQFPATIEFDFPQTKTVSDVVIHAGVPWQSMSTLLDYSLQYWDGGAWQTIEHVTEPTKTFKVYTPMVRCTVDSFFSDRYTFEHHFAPVQTSKVRLVVNDVTYGGGATADVVAAGGQTGPHQVVLREVEIYAPNTALPVISSQPANTSALVGQTVQLSVVAQATQAISYQWLRNGLAIPGAVTSTLQIPGVQPSDDGQYTALLSTSVGSVMTQGASLDVLQTASQWAGNYFSVADQANLPALLLQDSDHDGICNLVEFFHDTNPLNGISSSDRAGMTTTAIEYSGSDVFFTLTFRINRHASGLQYRVLGAPSLAAGVSWTVIQPDITLNLPVDPVTGDPRVTLKFKVTGKSAQFLRLSITQS